MKKTLIRAVALSAAIALTSVQFSFAAGGSVGHGDISVYQQGQLVSKLSGQNPLQDGSMLVCDGKCMVKSQGISLIAEDKSQIAVTNEADTFNLFVKEGKVDYVINSNARKVAFHTPQGTYTVAEVVFNASSGSVVKGSVEVNDAGETEISVTEGRLVFATADGMKTVDANNKIVLAVAPGGETGAGVIVGGLLAGGIVVGGLLANTNNDGGGTTGSTSTPSASPNQ